MTQRREPVEVTITVTPLGSGKNKTLSGTTDAIYLTATRGADWLQRVIVEIRPDRVIVAVAPTDPHTPINKVRRLGVVIAGPDGLRRPIFDPGMGVEFNGDATTDLAGDTFTVMAPLFTHPGVSAQGMCRTGRKPYDRPPRTYPG